MPLDYILIIISVLLLGGQFAFQRLFQLKIGTAYRSTLIFNALLGGFGAALCLAFALIFSQALPQFTIFSFICALLMAVCTTAYTLLGFVLMKNSGITLFTIFLMMGGMALPCIYGVSFLGEKCVVFNVAGLLLILGGIILANLRKAKGSTKNILIGIAVFLINGMCSIISKTHQIETVYATVSSPDFTFWTSLGKLALCAMVIPFLKAERGEQKVLPSALGCVICLGAAAMFVPSSMLQFVAAKTLPATVLYPIVSGGLIIVSAIIDRIFFKKKTSRTSICGITLCFLGTCLFL